MPNLGLTQAKWQEKFRMLGIKTSAMNQLRALLRHYRDRATRIREKFDQSAQLSNWSLTGVKIGVNTDHNGQLYVDAIVAGPNVTVDLYKDSAKAAPDKVATGVVAFPATLTLAQANSSGMSGSVVTAGGFVTDQDIILQAIQALGLRIDNAYPVEDATDSASKNRLQIVVQDTLQVRSRELQQSLKSAVDSELRVWLKKWTEAPDSVISDGDIMTYEYDTADNVITIKKEKGILPWFFDCMNDDATAGAQTILKNTITVGSLVKDADNVGDLNLSSTSTRENALSGKVRFTVVDETIGSEQLEIEHILNEPLTDATEIMKAENRATIKKAWIDGKIGFGFTPVRPAPTETGDNFNLLSNYIVTGETSANTDDGVIYFRLEREPANVWRLTAYTDGAHANTIGNGTATGTVGNENITITGLGISITTTLDKTAANANLPAIGNNDNDIQINLEVLKEGDSFSVTLTSDYAGEYQSDLAYYWHAQAPSAAVPTIKDGAGVTYDVVLAADETPTPV